MVIERRYAHQHQDVVPKAIGIKKVSKIVPLNHHTAGFNPKLCNAIFDFWGWSDGKHIENKQQRGNRHNHNFVTKEQKYK